MQKTEGEDSMGELEQKIENGGIAWGHHYEFEAGKGRQGEKKGGEDRTKTTSGREI